METPWLALALAALLAAAGPAAAQERRSNPFGDPFLQATDGLPECPVPRPPAYTEAQIRELAHERSQHGGSCHASGRCRLPNSYLYDAEIIPRVQRYLRQDGRFDDSAIWVLGQRRIVTLQGCVRNGEQARQAEEAVRLVDDVMGVVNLLQVR